MSRLSCAARAARVAMAGIVALAALGAPPAASQVQVADGLRAEVVATQIPRPLQLAFARSGRLIVLSHGWRGEAAGEIFSLDVGAALPLNASRLPRVVVPFASGPRKTVFGSLAVDPRSGDLFLGEENGNRIYRLTADESLTAVGVGLRHLVGGGSLAVDPQGRLLVLDFASPETQLRAETPLPPELDWLAADAYHGPLIFGIDPASTLPLPRRLDVLPPLFPRGWVTAGGGDVTSRFISVVAPAADRLLLLDSLGQLFRLGPETGLRRLARLPAGHYHRTNLAIAADGTVFVSSGFHMREIFRISASGQVTSIARELGDPAGIVLDAAGALYVAETALHRIIRIHPAR